MCTAENKWLPSVDPRDVNTPKKLWEQENKHRKSSEDLIKPDKPPPPPAPVKYQQAKSADSKPLTRRNTPGGMASTAPTMLGGGTRSGTAYAGQVTLLGG